ncbi:MAG: DUF5026 domain-containing protein [Lachnospiraceae bacterium]
MALITEKPVKVFDLSQIGRGCLIWGRHSTWAEGKTGIVTSAAEDQLVVQYYPYTGNLKDYFTIPVQEAAAGEWEIRWSSRLEEIHMYGTATEDSRTETEDVADGT